MNKILGNWLYALQSSVVGLCYRHTLPAIGGASRIGSYKYLYSFDGQNNARFSSSKTAFPAYPLHPFQSSDTLIEAWCHTVAPRGTLHLNLPFNTVVRPLNPQSYPDMDKAIIELHFDSNHGTEVPNSQNMSQIRDFVKLDVKFDQEIAKMNVAATTIPGVTIPMVCMMWIPLQSDLTASVLSNSNLTVEKLEGNSLDLSAQQGNCYLKNLKCGSLNVQCSAGDIISQSTMLGNIVFHAGACGGILADKLQGSSVVCQTEMGNIHVKSLYTDTAVMGTLAGSIKLGQCHGKMTVQGGRSDVEVGSMEGDVDIGLNQGSVNLYLSRHSNSSIDVEDGNISLSFPDGVQTDLKLDCSHVNLGNNVTLESTNTDVPNQLKGYIGQTGLASVQARTRSGTIAVSQRSWIQSTNLNFQQDES